ncbi:MAG: methyltransferase domain-containing protein [Sandaracinaceae bacterium]|nr:methyltransferase domain-containing protein [Sandaracinaceae bacterium]
MLRFPDDDARALRALPSPPLDLEGPALEAAVDAHIAALRHARVGEAAKRGVLARLHAELDRAIRTDRPEHLDERDFPAEEKLRIVGALHGMNLALGSYWRMTRVLRPLVEDVARRLGRPARLLELASGSGELALALGREIRRAGLPVEVTGSDYVAEYVEAGRAKARARGLPVCFEVVDAFDMQRLEAGRFDLVFIAQSVHHFGAGQLARMVSESRRVATTAFVAIDGRRSLKLLAFLPLSATLGMRRSFVHDAMLSGRKLYPASELAEIARLGAGDAQIEVRHDRPGYHVLVARWDAR